MRVVLAAIISLVLILPVTAQDFGWWNDAHEWDGTTHWTRYMKVSPAWMGPNALPVPEIKKGLLQEDLSLELAIDNHFSKGDKTQNLYTEIYIPLAPGKVGLKVFMVPVEHYAMDSLTNIGRISRDKDGEGYSAGDVYFSTWIQLLKNHQSLPDLMITINLKTASGTNLEAARHTDSPGYYFDLSAGKTYNTAGNKLISVRAYAMAGFYLWQTHSDFYYQNDSFLYGAGAELNFKRFSFNNNIGGYTGYIGMGDSPLVFRSQLTYILGSGHRIKTSFQQGLNDFEYSSVRIALDFNLSK